MRRLLALLCLLAGMCLGLAAQAPPVPTRWVTDGPGLLSPAVRDGLDRRLEAYQRVTGHQVLVWVGTTTGGAPLEDWTVKAFAAWKVGRKGMDDGLVLFVMAGDHRVRMEVGYGLEGTVPDVVAYRIIQESIIPRLKAGDPDGGVTAGVDRILKVAGGDTGEARPRQAAGASFSFSSLGLGTKIILGLLALAFLALVVTHPGMAIWFLLDILTSGGGGGSGGGSSGGGGFSGGGGSSGGGGASGSW